MTSAKRPSEREITIALLGLSYKSSLTKEEVLESCRSLGLFVAAPLGVMRDTILMITRHKNDISPGLLYKYGVYSEAELRENSTEPYNMPYPILLLRKVLAGYFSSAGLTRELYQQLHEQYCLMRPDYQGLLLFDGLSTQQTLQKIQSNNLMKEFLTREEKYPGTGYALLKFYDIELNSKYGTMELSQKEEMIKEIITQYAPTFYRQEKEFLYDLVKLRQLSWILELYGIDRGLKLTEYTNREIRTMLTDNRIIPWRALNNPLEQSIKDSAINKRVLTINHLKEVLEWGIKNHIETLPRAYSLWNILTFYNNDNENINDEMILHYYYYLQKFADNSNILLRERINKILYIERLYNGYLREQISLCNDLVMQIKSYTM